MRAWATADGGQSSRASWGTTPVFAQRRSVSGRTPMLAGGLGERQRVVHGRGGSSGGASLG